MEGDTLEGDTDSRAERAREPGPDELAGMLARGGSFSFARKTEGGSIDGGAADRQGGGEASGAASREAGGIEWIQTHISHVFLTSDRVFKLRKAVQQPFLDFGRRADRNLDCLREVALNRRLAPDVYLGIAPIVVTDGKAHVGPVAETIGRDDLEHVVVMRRLPDRRDALALLEDGRLRAEQLEDVAALLADFHATENLGAPAPFSEQEWFERTAEPTLECVRALRQSGLVEAERVRLLEIAVQDRLSDLRPEFERRRLAGRAVDAHGDLHLDHVWFETDESPPILIDCIEFNEDLRRIDAASELAFLSMDLRYRGRSDLADDVLSTYATHGDDYGLFGVVDFFAAYRALVRAKVAALAAGQESIEADQRARARRSIDGHLRLAARLLEPAGSAELVVLCGTVGTGKSSVARARARAGQGIQISSDRVRKRLAGLTATTRLDAGPDEGIYRPDQTEAVYRALLERAAPVIASGRSAILDASFARRAHRDQAREWAGKRGVACRLIEVRCAEQTAAERLRERELRGRDPSDAGPDFLEISRSRFEPPDEWPEESHEIVWTDRPRPEASGRE